MLHRIVLKPTKTQTSPEPFLYFPHWPVSLEVPTSISYLGFPFAFEQACHYDSSGAYVANIAASSSLTRTDYHFREVEPSQETENSFPLESLFEAHPDIIQFRTWGKPVEPFLTNATPKQEGRNPHPQFSADDVKHPPSALQIYALSQIDPALAAPFETLYGLYRLQNPNLSELYTPPTKRTVSRNAVLIECALAVFPGRQQRRIAIDALAEFIPMMESLTETVAWPMNVLTMAYAYSDGAVSQEDLGKLHMNDVMIFAPEAFTQSPEDWRPTIIMHHSPLHTKSVRLKAKKDPQGPQFYQFAIFDCFNECANAEAPLTETQFYIPDRDARLRNDADFMAAWVVLETLAEIQTKQQLEAAGLPIELSSETASNFFSNIREQQAKTLVQYIRNALVEIQ